MLRLAVACVAINLALGLSRIPTPRLDGKIVGGEAANIEEYPYQLSLIRRGRHICGASIISSRYAVTAAHCTFGSNSSALTIRAGTSKRDQGGKVYNLESIHQHPKYSAENIDYDISVLKLAEELVFSDVAKPVKLPAEEDDVAAGSPAICTGWGSLKSGSSSLPNQLQRVKLAITERQKCEKAYKQGGHEITERMICAGVPQGGKDACQGDSGGPLVVRDELVGVVSWGIGCGVKKYPGVYSNVPKLRGFIKEVSGI